MAYNRTQVSHGEGVDLTHGGPEAPLAGEGVEGEQRVARHGEDELRQREVHQQPVERGPQLHTQIEIEISFELVKILYNCTLQIFLDFEPHLIIQRGIE